MLTAKRSHGLAGLLSLWRTKEVAALDPPQLRAQPPHQGRTLPSSLVLGSLSLVDDPCILGRPGSIH